MIDPPDVLAFQGWLPKGALRKADAAHSKQKHQSRPVITEIRSDGSIPDCGCQDVAPWEECIHNEQPLDDEAAARLSHLLSS